MTTAKVRELPWRTISLKEKAILSSVAELDEDGEVWLNSQGIDDFVDYLVTEMARVLQADASELWLMIKNENKVFYRRKDSLIIEKGVISIHDPVFDLFQVPQYEEVNQKDFFARVGTFSEEFRENPTVKKWTMTYLLLVGIALVFSVVFISLFRLSIKNPEEFVKFWYSFGIFITIVGTAASIAGVLFFIYKVVRYSRSVVDKKQEGTLYDETTDTCYDDVWSDEDLEQMSNPSRDRPYEQSQEID